MPVTLCINFHQFGCQNVLVTDPSIRPTTDVVSVKDAGGNMEFGHAVLSATNGSLVLRLMGTGASTAFPAIMNAVPSGNLSITLTSTPTPVVVPVTYVDDDSNTIATTLPPPKPFPSPLMNVPSHVAVRFRSAEA